MSEEDRPSSGQDCFLQDFNQFIKNCIIPEPHVNFSPIVCQPGLYNLYIPRNAYLRSGRWFQQEVPDVDAWQSAFQQFFLNRRAAYCVELRHVCVDESGLKAKIMCYENCMDCVRLQQQNAYLTQIMHTWYSERTTREDCSVCWKAMSPDELHIPMCGHFICTSCKARCHCCPVCRD